MPNPPLHNRMIESITRIQIKSMSWLNNNTNKNTIVSCNFLQKKRNINCWITRVAKDSLYAKSISCRIMQLLLKRSAHIESFRGAFGVRTGEMRRVILIIALFQKPFGTGIRARVMKKTLSQSMKAMLSSQKWILSLNMTVVRTKVTDVS